MENAKITFIQTGGTIDKDYPRKTKGWAFEIGEPAIYRILDKIGPSFDYEVKTVFQKDSLEISQQDREYLVSTIKDIEDNRIIITHGTDTMIETARVLDEQIRDKIIIVTGAMLPERFSNSDAEFNIGCAVGAINSVENGVYIAMNGLVKKLQDINRNLETGKYY